MGRYTTVQAYADNNANMRSVSYDQASGSAEPKKGVVKPEKVENPYGSTAGAGSGEFHVYRHARSREMARWKQLDEEEKQKQLDEEYNRKLEANKTEEEQRTEKRRRKRQRQKEAKLRKKNLERAGVVAQEQPVSREGEDEEFSYNPLKEEETNVTEKALKGPPTRIPPIEFIKNDGSFLEQMKKRLAEESRKEETDAVEEPPTKRQAMEG